MDIQALLDGMSEADRLTRSHYHLTLGEMVKFLSDKRRNLPIKFDTGVFPGRLGSYRGYYSDLAIAPSSDPLTIEGFLPSALAAIGAEFTGYKGGEFRMNSDTPLWLSDYGICSDIAIVGIYATDDEVVLQTKQVAS